MVSNKLPQVLNYLTYSTSAVEDDTVLSKLYTHINDLLEQESLQEGIEKWQTIGVWDLLCHLQHDTAPVATRVLALKLLASISDKQVGFTQAYNQQLFLPILNLRSGDQRQRRTNLQSGTNGTKCINGEAGFDMNNEVTCVHDMNSSILSAALYVVLSVLAHSSGTAWVWRERLLQDLVLPCLGYRSIFVQRAAAAALTRALQQLHEPQAAQLLNDVTVVSGPHRLLFYTELLNHEPQDCRSLCLIEPHLHQLAATAASLSPAQRQRVAQLRVHLALCLHITAGQSGTHADKLAPCTKTDIHRPTETRDIAAAAGDSAAAADDSGAAADDSGAVVADFVAGSSVADVAIPASAGGSATPAPTNLLCDASCDNAVQLLTELVEQDERDTRWSGVLSACSAATDVLRGCCTLPAALQHVAALMQVLPLLTLQPQQTAAELAAAAVRPLRSCHCSRDHNTSSLEAAVAAVATRSLQRTPTRSLLLTSLRAAASAAPLLTKATCVAVVRVVLEQLPANTTDGAPDQQLWHLGVSLITTLLKRDGVADECPLGDITALLCRTLAHHWPTEQVGVASVSCVWVCVQHDPRLVTTQHIKQCLERCLCHMSWCVRETAMALLTTAVTAAQCHNWLADGTLWRCVSSLLDSEEVFEQVAAVAVVRAALPQLSDACVCASHSWCVRVCCGADAAHAAGEVRTVAWGLLGKIHATHSSACDISCLGRCLPHAQHCSVSATTDVRLAALHYLCHHMALPESGTAQQLAESLKRWCRDGSAWSVVQCSSDAVHAVKQTAVQHMRALHCVIGKHSLVDLDVSMCENDSSSNIENNKGGDSINSSNTATATTSEDHEAILQEVLDHSDILTLASLQRPTDAPTAAAPCCPATPRIPVASFVDALATAAIATDSTEAADDDVELIGLLDDILLGSVTPAAALTTEFGPATHSTRDCY